MSLIILSSICLTFKIGKGHKSLEHVSRNSHDMFSKPLHPSAALSKCEAAKP